MSPFIFCSHILYVFLHSHLNKHRSGGSFWVDSGWRNGETNTEHTQKQAPHLIQHHQYCQYMDPYGCNALSDIFFFSCTLSNATGKKLRHTSIGLNWAPNPAVLQIPFEEQSSYNRASRRDTSKGIHARLLQMKRLMLLNVLLTSLDHPEKCAVVWGKKNF